MAPKAGRIQQRTRVAEFDIDGDDWRVEFHPISSDMIKAATRGSLDEQYDAGCKLLGDSIIAWNLEDDNGQPMPIAPDKTLPPSEEGGEPQVVMSPGMAWLRSVGLDYVNLLMEGLTEALKVPKGKGSTSNGSFSRAA